MGIDINTDIDLSIFNNDNDENNVIESKKMPTARILKKKLKTKYLNMLKQEQLQDVLKELPEKGYISYYFKW